MRNIKKIIGLMIVVWAVGINASSAVNALTISQPVANTVFSTTNITVSGAANPGRTVVISQNGKTLGTVIADGSGSWSTQVTVSAGSTAVKATEISPSYGYFGTAGVANGISRILSGSTTLNDGGGSWPLTTTKVFLAPVGVRPQGDSVYWASLGEANRVPARLDIGSPVDPVEASGYPSNPSFGVSKGAFNKPGTKLYVPNDGLDTVEIIDYSSNTTIGSIGMPAGYMPSISMSPNGSIYVPVDNTIYVIDPDTDTVVRSFPVSCIDPSSLSYISFPRGRDYYYVPCSQDGLIYKLRVSDDSVISVLDVGALTQQISIVDEGLDPSKLYVSGIYNTVTGDKIMVVDSSNGSLISTITLTDQAIAPSITPDGQYIYAATQGAAFGTFNIDVVSAVSDTLVGQIDTSALGLPGIIAWLPGEEVETEVGVTVVLPILAQTGESKMTSIIFSSVILLASGALLAHRVIVFRRSRNLR